MKRSLQKINISRQGLPFPMEMVDLINLACWDVSEVNQFGIGSSGRNFRFFGIVK